MNRSKDKTNHMKNLTLKDFLVSIDYKICGSGEYLWDCYGENAHFLDAEKSNGSKFLFSTGIIFDTKSHKVYQMDSWDYKKGFIYRWFHPKYFDKFILECKKRGVNPFLDEEKEKNYEVSFVSAARIIKETIKVMKNKSLC